MPVVTTPYILIGTAKADWTAYLNKNLMGTTGTEKSFHEFVKFGKAAKSDRAESVLERVRLAGVSPLSA